MVSVPAPAQRTETEGCCIYTSYADVAAAVIKEAEGVLQPKVCVAVEDSLDQLEVENAFLHALQGRNCRTFLKRSEKFASMDSLLELRVHVKRTTEKNDTPYQNPGKKTIVTVQWYNTENGAAGVFGPFNIRPERRNENSDVPKSNWLENFLTPLLVVGSSILIVYLFFVVRS